MKFTNARIGRVKPSETLAVKSKAAALRQQGRSVIDLSAGEPDIDTPEHIKEAAYTALKQGHTKYTNVSGIAELRSALCDKLRSENSIDAEAESIIVTNGGKQAIYSFFDVTLEKGDEVIIPAPYWVSYPAIVELCSGTPVIVKCKAENGLKLQPQELKDKLTAKTRCFVINSPSNPCGIGYEAQELQALGEVLESYPNCLILSDEVYEKIVFNNFKFTSFAAACPKLADRVFTVNAFSKSYSMTGWRVGYAHGPSDIISAMGRHQSQTTSNVCSPAQYAALAALKGPQDFINQMISDYSRRIEKISKIFTEIPGIRVDCMPRGAFYLFVNFTDWLKRKNKSHLKGSADFAEYLLDKRGVAVVPGEAFGDDYAFRLSVSSSDSNIEQGVERIVQFLSDN